MTLTDISILTRKIMVGIIVYLIPVGIIVGSLLVTKTLLKKEKDTGSNTINIITNQ